MRHGGWVLMMAMTGLSLGMAQEPKPAEPARQSDQDSTPPITIALNGSPVIDGKVDDVWAKAKEVQVRKPVKDLTVVEKEQMATATVKLLWDETHLYALWVVKDTKLSVDHYEDWQQDSVELFLDRNLKRTVFYQYDDAQYRVNYEGKVSGQGEGYVAEDLQAAASVNDSGYVVEMSILIPGRVMEPGHKMGVEMQVNDHRGGQGRDAVTKWNHDEDDSWENTSNFGIVELQ